MLKKEWKSLFHNKLLLVVVLAIITIPTIYTTLFLGSMWDPYGNLDKLPVAVVNADQPVAYDGTTLNVGNDLVKNLKKEDSLCFNFVGKEAAERGLKNGTYYMVITIPENFSKNASTLMDKKPEKMVLDYDTNPGTNYIASKMSETAMEKVKNSVAEEVTKTYTQTVFDQITAVGDGMQEAADGTAELKDGVAKLSDGNQTITENLKTLADSSLTFKEGSDTLHVGLKDYVDGVTSVDGGALALNTGAAQLKDGTDELNGKVPELSDGITQLASGAKLLADGTSKTLTGGKQLKDGAKAVDDNMAVLNSGLTSLQDQTSSLPAAASQLNAGAQALDTGAAQLQQGIDSVYDGARQVQSGASVLNQGLTALDQNSDDLLGGLDQVEQGILGALSQMLPSGSVPAVSADTSGITSGLQTIADASGAARDEADKSAETAAGISGSNQGSDAGYLYDALNEATASGDPDAVAAVASEAIALAQGNYDAADALSAEALSAAQALTESSSALTEAGNVMEQAAGISDQLPQTAAGNSETSNTALGNPADLITQAFAAYKELLSTYTDGVRSAKSGSDLLTAGIQGSQTASDPGLIGGISAVRDGIYASKDGLDTLSAGTDQLNGSTPALIQGIAAAKEGSDALKTQGTSVLKSGSYDLYTGLTQVNEGSSTLEQGTQSLASNLPSLSGGIAQLAGGADQLFSGTDTLLSGTGQLVSNNAKLLNGVSALSDGASQISSGSGKLYDGSKELGDGISQAADGTDTLNTSLSDGAKEVKDTKTTDDTVDMFAAPVKSHETKITTVENNGHAMAPYMMSVALWVGCIAFSLMYPLTKYQGRLKSGFSWWLSKASVLYLIAILQAAVMILLLHVFDGFNPVEMGKTLFVACLASVAFMSVMYFFTNSFGKAGSFLMLIFMVVQLAGSVGTYPLELSGSFVPMLHGWVPFTYTVEAFRSTISGGESIHGSVLFLTVIFIVFTVFTVIEFQLRARKIKAGRPILADWLEDKGLA